MKSDQQNVSSGPIPGSRKIYVQGELFDIAVPMREIGLSPTQDLAGELVANDPVVVYDTSGPYSDENYEVDLARGLPRLRQKWIEERGDTMVLRSFSSEYGRRRLENPELADLRFAHANVEPRQGLSGKR